MTKATYRKNYRKLVREVAKNLRVYGENALKSGCLDLPSDDSSFLTPKNVMCAALQGYASPWGYGPRRDDRKNNRTIANIRATTPSP